MNVPKRRGRPTIENPMIHTAIALPKELLERLKKSAGEHYCGVSSEIRRRLVESYSEYDNWRWPS